MRKVNLVDVSSARECNKVSHEFCIHIKLVPVNLAMLAIQSSFRSLHAEKIEFDRIFLIKKLKYHHRVQKLIQWRVWRIWCKRTFAIEFQGLQWIIFVVSHHFIYADCWCVSRLNNDNEPASLRNERGTLQYSSEEAINPETNDKAFLISLWKLH